eukprot:scaffold7806_cov376-Prasinococcus_capsulatus_cf.AAC.1
MASRLSGNMVAATPARASRSSFVRGAPCRVHLSAPARVPGSSRLAARCVQAAPTGTTSKTATAGNDKTAVVVGAGVGGLAMAGRLARAGYKVCAVIRTGSWNSVSTY